MKTTPNLKSETTITMNCQLEIDAERGVIYLHSLTTGTTILRICSLPSPIPNPLDEMLDITHMRGASWRGVDKKKHVTRPQKEIYPSDNADG